MDPALFWQLPLLFLAGIAAGLLNVLAGGGSLLTLPLLIFMGLPSSIANGTNRVAIFFQCLFAIRGFRKRGYFPLELILLCTPPALFGSWLGAGLAISMDDLLFKRVLGIIMIGVLVLSILDPMKRMTQDAARLGTWHKVVLFISFFFVGVYGGFVQAGVGFIIIFALLFHGLDLLRINAVKVFVVFLYTAVALGVFVYHGQVNYSLGIGLAAGNSIGGMMAPRIAVAKGHDWIKKVVNVAVFIFAMKLLVFP
ncbi:MAG: sulfite exporter TauE/SafE family protein [Desulfobacteraceae bacterium]|nr:MAG: sulfite exporter TauE/SafE family protein [Desulfobacteraceae bacterium]